MTDNTSNNPEDNYPEAELADLWNRQETPMASTANPHELAQLAASIRTEHRAEQVRLVWLNIREVIPSVAGAAFFSWLAVSEEGGRLGYLISAVLCLGVGLFLVGVSIRQHRIEQHFDTSLRGLIGKSLSQARSRYWMYRNTGWWYFTPLALALTVFYVTVVQNDPNGWKPGDAVAGLGMAVLFGGLYWLNRRIAATKWQPEVERLEGLLADLDE